MSSDSWLSRSFALLHLTIVAALVSAELGGLIRMIVPRFAPPAALPVAAAPPALPPLERNGDRAVTAPASKPIAIPELRTSNPASAPRPELAPDPGQAQTPRRWHPLQGVEFIPERREGRTLGLRLSGVSEGGLFSQLGLRDGDRLDSVAGYRVTSPNEMIALYTRLRALDVLKMAIERDGQPMTITIRLR